MQRVGDLVRAFLAGRLTGESERTAALIAATREILGEAGRHTRVRDVRGHTLILEADHPGWAQLIGMRKAEVLRLLAGRVAGTDIRELRVFVGSSAETPTATRKSRRSPTTDRSALGGSLTGVRDEKLKRSLMSLYDQAVSGAEDTEVDQPRIDTRIDRGEKPGV